MARLSPKKKPVKTRLSKVARVKRKAVERSGPGTKKPAKSRGTPVKKAAAKLRGGTPQAVKKRAAGGMVKESRSQPTVQRKRITRFGTPIPAPEHPPRLLPDTKSTSAALALLEKGIKLIHQRDFRKARLELESIAQAHPGEHEIIARSKSYLQICEREETARKKPPAVTNDQIYTLGVMEHNRGNYTSAISYFEQSLAKNPKSDHILYSLSASRAKNGEVAGAVANLREAIMLNEDNRIYAKNDPDFASLHSEEGFLDLVGMSAALPTGSTRA